MWKGNVFTSMLFCPQGLYTPLGCLLRSSVSVWVSVWVIWRITNRHSVKYAELRIGILLKVCRFLIRHTLPNADVISSYHAVKYAELRIGILPILNSSYHAVKYAELRIGSILKVCRFVIRHITQTETQMETEANFTHPLGRHPPRQTPTLGKHPPWEDSPPPGRHPQTDRPLGRHPPGRHPPRQTTPHPRDSHCSGRYASYWNAFLYFIYFSS